MIEEMPQHLWKARQGLAKDVMFSGFRVGNVVARTLDHTTLAVDAAKEVIKCFVKTQSKVLASKSETTSTELISGLQDCIDDFSVGEMTPSDRAASSSAARGSHGYATTDEMKEVPEANLVLAMKEFGYLLMRDATPSVIHGELWRKNTEKLLPGCIHKLELHGRRQCGMHRDPSNPF